MDLSHEEKIIAMRGFEDAMEKDAASITAPGLALRKGWRALKSGFKSKKSDKALARSMNIGRKGTDAEKKLMRLGMHVGDNAAAYGAAAGGAAGAGAGAGVLSLLDD